MRIREQAKKIWHLICSLTHVKGCENINQASEHLLPLQALPAFKVTPGMLMPIGHGHTDGPQTPGIHEAGVHLTTLTARLQRLVLHVLYLTRGKGGTHVTAAVPGIEHPSFGERESSVFC